MPRYQNPADINFYQGEPTPNGKLFFFESGTSTPKATYANVGETTQNAQPVLLDSAGREPNIFFSGSAKVILQDENGQQVWERDPVGGESVLGNFSDFNIAIIYGLNDTVQTSDGRFYQSNVAANQGNDPLTSPTQWTEIRFLGIYNAARTYIIGEIVQSSTGILFTSQVNSNLGNDPLTDSGANWLQTNKLAEGITNSAISHFYRNR